MSAMSVRAGGLDLFMCFYFLGSMHPVMVIDQERMRIGQLVDEVEARLPSHERDRGGQRVRELCRRADDRDAVHPPYRETRSGIYVVRIADPADLHILFIISGS